MQHSVHRRSASTMIFLALLLAFTIIVTLLSEGMGVGVISTSFVKTLGKTLCLALVAISMDLVWGYAGILSLGHFAFFGLGGYMIGMWLMYERTREIVVTSLADAPIPPTAQEVSDAIANQIFGVVGSAEFPLIWAFADSLLAQLMLVVLVPGVLAGVFGWLAFRSRVAGVYLSILTQAMTLALSLYLFQNDNGLRGNNGLSGLQNLPGLADVSQALVSVWFLWGAALALGLGYLLAFWVVSGKFGSVLRGIRDDEARVRFLGYPVETYKLVLFTGSACMAGIAGALYYPQAGIINPAEMAPIASIYLAVWVAIGGRGRLYGAVIGAAFVSLVSSWFTGGQAPDVPLGFYTVKWVDWWLVVLGLSFVLVTLYAPKGIGGLFDLLGRRASPDRHGADLGPDQGALREKEASE
ncbi:urea ABC transporter permease subunit UrtC [Roseovarius arcticus]|uniref:urea ABC transporter permease subunit UrtC n=1 Tax=Roseovarius arcticus TaxID=2547404 RepID=UPI001110A1D0|nr:urea ABC transporter permease subunit UrtC [Roseovarius arcticus]